MLLKPEEQKFFGSFFQKRTFLPLLVCINGHAWADAATTSAGGGVDAATGKAVYEHVCQGCHQANARGAMGAGAGFPALANNKKLEVVGYPISMVESGHGGMPWFNGTLSDAQVAAVINYVRSHFGNDYKDTITAADVAASHGPAPIVER
jgi:mono/diheme cytochrome c family protein